MSNEYSISEFIKTTYSLILTKIFYKGARLIRRPFYVRGRKSIHFGDGFTSGRECRFDLLAKGKSNLVIGENCKIGDRVHIVCHGEIIIGDNCLLASNIFISDTSHGSYGMNSEGPDMAPEKRKLIVNKVCIGSNVWIGENVCIMPGVTIGDGCVVGANSVVTKNIPKNSVIAGVPAIILKAWDGNGWKKNESY
ncbi:DapH/DapD/GlmU-related protein [Paucilactobacillus nenjiangensis]|uniref:DapH/DapD/GlmU-related protein n=1 Tax=Paucilactobacillus nenjiangensis TaxID=1296540 RepID=UPI0028D62E98|nr:DapH/DapD/GlmU-related protein [Paucilactobacillus nenjiangensis]